MKLHRIETFEELEKFMPLILQQKRMLKDRWGEDSEESYMRELISGFNQNLYFAEESNGTLLYFFALAEITQNTELCMFVRSVYVDKTLYPSTSDMIEELKKIAKFCGFRTVIWSSTRLGKSYQKWMNKLGARLVSRVYKMEL